MILFINGPFGIGKTTVAEVLVQKIPHSMLYDPEVIGAALRRILVPFRGVEDFQDYALWRTLVVGGARLSRGVSGLTLVIPMTVYRRNVFDPIVAGLRRADPNLWCFRLTAPREVLVERISSDAEDGVACAWRTSHVGACLKALRDPAFGTEIRTEDRTPPEVAEQILKALVGPAGGDTN